MRIRVSFVIFALALLSLPLAAQRGGRGNAAAAPSPPHDPHDLTGIWNLAGGTDLSLSRTPPPLTPEGQKRFDANKPSYGRELGSADAAAHPEEHIGRRRALPPANDTDPYQHCNPEGVTRADIYPDPIEILQLPDRMIIQYEWTYGTRTLWMDGRKPLAEPALPRWWGYSTGHWEGNTLVVETT